MIIKTVNLETVIGVTSKLPENHLPEFAFSGKSNVGKSSLINALMNRKAYARTSSQPGKTQTINFYNINDALYYVDLPGYGYAKVALAAKEKWGKMIERYLRQSPMLKMVFLLVDIRHEPTEDDRQMNLFLRQTGIPFTVIATKADKISRGARQKQLAPICRALLVQPWEIICFSSEDRTGREALLARIEEVLAAEEPGEDSAHSMEQPT